jgi:hypothetical protein
MRSCASEDEPTVATAPYVAPDAFHLVEPDFPTERLDGGSIPPGQIDVFPETPPPRLS